MRPANIRAYNVAGTKIAKEVTHSKYGASFCIFSKTTYSAQLQRLLQRAARMSIQRTSATPMTWNSFSFRINCRPFPERVAECVYGDDGILFFSAMGWPGQGHTAVWNLQRGGGTSCGRGGRTIPGAIFAIREVEGKSPEQNLARAYRCYRVVVRNSSD